jgi:hypothetical protein
MFTMPTDEQIAHLSAREIEDLRDTCLKDISKIKQAMLVVKLEMNDLSRQEAEIHKQKLDLRDKLSKGSVAMSDLDVCADRLKSLYFQKR